jgi:hypothetical protein
VRLANAGSMNVAFTAAPDGKRARLHIVNYAGRTGLNPVTVTLLGRYRFAKFRDLERTEPMTLPLRTEYGRTALYLPGFRICAVLDLEM